MGTLGSGGSRIPFGREGAGARLGGEGSMRRGRWEGNSLFVPEMINLSVYF